MQAKDDYEKVAQAQARGLKKGNVKKMKFMQTEGEEIPVTSPRCLQRYDSMNAKVGNDVVVVQEDQDKETMTRMSSNIEKGNNSQVKGSGLEGEGMAFNNHVGKEQKLGVTVEVVSVEMKTETKAVEGIEGYKRLFEVEEDDSDELADLFSDYEVEGSQEGEGMAFNNIVGKEQKHGVEVDVEGNKRLIEVEEDEADELADLFSDYEDSQQGMSTDVEAGIFSGA